MVNRPDADSVPGGDTIQLQETKAGLERLGVDVVQATVNDLPRYSGFELLHVFNWEQLEPVLRCQEAGACKGTPLFLSTIFWYHTGHWFSQAIAARRRWELLSRSLGTGRCLRLYQSWQQAKFRWGGRGRKLRRNLSVPAQLLPNSQLEINHLQAVLRLGRIPRARIKIVPNGVKRELFDPRPAPDKSFWQEYGLRGFVLQVARIQAAKNQLGLIEALYDLPVPIVFAGQPSPYETEYVNRCRALAEARGRVYFVGTRSPRVLAGIYALAGVHVLPSWRETPGLASLEAAAAGCPVVSTSEGSAREYFGDLAWYCDPWDPATIRQAVEQALEMPPSDSLRSRVLERYTWDVAAEATLEAYRRVLK